MSYIICFWDKSKLQVSDENGEKLQQAILKNQIKNFKLGPDMYSVSGIEKIITKDRAWDVFPAEFKLLSEMSDVGTTLPALEAPKLPFRPTADDFEKWQKIHPNKNFQDYLLQLPEN